MNAHDRTLSCQNHSWLRKKVISKEGDTSFDDSLSDFIRSGTTISLPHCHEKCNSQTSHHMSTCDTCHHVIPQMTNNIQRTPENIQKTPENKINKSCLFRQSWPHVRNKPSSDSLAGHIRRGTIGTKTSCPGTQRNTNTKSIWRTWFVTILARECTWQNSLLSKP